MKKNGGQKSRGTIPLTPLVTQVNFHETLLLTRRLGEMQGIILMCPGFACTPSGAVCSKYVQTYHLDKFNRRKKRHTFHYTVVSQFISMSKKYFT
jgi:hypothetical protein